MTIESKRYIPKYIIFDPRSPNQYIYIAGSKTMSAFGAILILIIGILRLARSCSKKGQSSSRNSIGVLRHVLQLLVRGKYLTLLASGDSIKASCNRLRMSKDC